MEFKPFSIAEAMNNAQGLAMNKYKMDELSNMMQAKEGLQRAVSDGSDQAMDLYRKQFPEQARQWDAGNLQMSSAKLKQAMDRAEYIGQLASGVGDEQSYQSALAEAKRVGIPVDNAPRNYDPRWVQQTVMQALTVKDRLAMMAKDQPDFIKTTDALGITRKEAADLYRKKVTKPQTQINMGDKQITVNDAKDLVNAQGQPPPIGMTYGDAAKEGYRVKPDKLTEAQGNAVSFGIRATEAAKAIDSMMLPNQKTGKADYDPTGLGAAKDMSTAGGTFTNWMASKQGQKYMNNSRNFVAAVLRKESGAQIANTEWEWAVPLYIPIPGDGPDVLAQKAENRKQAIAGLNAQAGPGTQQIKANTGANLIPTGMTAAQLEDVKANVEKGDYSHLWKR